MLDIVTASLLSLIVVFGSLVLLFMQVLNNRIRSRNDELLDTLAKEGSFAQLWEVCKKIGLVSVMGYAEKRRSSIHLGCFRNRISKTVSWEQLATTVGSFIANGEFSTEDEMTELALRLSEFFGKNSCSFLVEDFIPKAAERYKGTPKQDIVLRLEDAVCGAKFIIVEREEKLRRTEEEQKKKERIEKILLKNYRIGKSDNR